MPRDPEDTTVEELEADEPAETPEVAEARKKADAMLGPVWLERAHVALFSLAIEGHPDRVADARARKALEHAVAAQRDPAFREALAATARQAKKVWAAVWGPHPRHANRSEFVRLLAGAWRRKPDDERPHEPAWAFSPPFPSATAWAYFDLAIGWTNPADSVSASGSWRSLVGAWQAELRKVGLGSEQARNGPGARS